MAKLAIMTGTLQGQIMTLPEKDITIGREKGCEIRLSGTEISRRHCLIRVAGDYLTAQDLGSRNGCYVNDVLITEETRLNQGDLLRVGTMVFKVELTPPKVETPVPQPKVQTGKPAGKAKTPDYEEMVEVHTPSEDSIVNWLVDEAPEGGTGDSTIVARTPEASSGNAAPSPVPAAAPVKAPPKKQFATVKDEAADIIKRHLESLKTPS